MQDSLKNNSTFSERLAQILDYQVISPQEFARKLGYTRAQSIYDFLNGKVNPSFVFFQNFVKSEFSEKINLNWLISGEGEMAKPENPDAAWAINRPEGIKSGVANRIAQYINHIGLPYLHVCEDVLKLDADQVTAFITGDAPVSDSIIRRVSFVFEDINLEWLLTGIGLPSIAETPQNMENLLERARIFDLQADSILTSEQLSNDLARAADLIQKDQSTEIRDYGPFASRYLITTPYIPPLRDQEFQYYIEMWDDISEIDLFDRHSITLDSFKFGVYRSFVAHDNALNSEEGLGIREGDVVTGRRVEWRKRTISLLQVREVIVVSKSEVYFRKVQTIDRQGNLVLEAANADRKVYPDLTISTEDILEIYEIEALTRYPRKKNRI
ncbi:hypothetical protein SAMN04487996_107134 [Dyadobacter soli]|uniref:Uncharacterized protein n=1 Tax=Dyadobacter soli TaxID=659014 RepID=A0A1G7G5N6_9BACT|nr:hypothetical protein [Dyadobacter soli]SDE83464.1 hypothetical protein SAMN04487996_107134 [Dyadobacter soli]